MNILFFDTETTGKALFKMPVSHPGQPHIVQLAAILTDGTGEHQCEMNQIVRPDGYEIPIEASNIHGITTAMAIEQGKPLAEVMAAFAKMVEMADLVVAHNIQFDHLMVQIECSRRNEPSPLSPKACYCTMKTATPICNLPGPYGPKWPTLTEAYSHFFHKAFEDAHDAMGDVKACKAVYFAMNPPKAPWVAYVCDCGNWDEAPAGNGGKLSCSDECGRMMREATAQDLAARDAKRAERATCGPLYLEGLETYGCTKDMHFAFACGFVSGQAEKVFLGACPAAMFRPSPEHFEWLYDEVTKIAVRYGLEIAVLPSAQSKTPDEIWIFREGYAIGRWHDSPVNSPNWHYHRAAACGIPNDRIDYKFHERQGYNQVVDAPKQGVANG